MARRTASCRGRPVRLCRPQMMDRSTSSRRPTVLAIPDRRTDGDTFGKPRWLAAFGDLAVRSTCGTRTSTQQCLTTRVARVAAREDDPTPVGCSPESWLSDPVVTVAWTSRNDEERST